jgi:hypothetical protein
MTSPCSFSDRGSNIAVNQQDEDGGQFDKPVSL